MNIHMTYGQLLRSCRGHIVSVGYKSGAGASESGIEKLHPVFVKGHGLLVEGRFAVLSRRLHFSMPMGRGVRYYARPAGPGRASRRTMALEFLDSDDERGISVFRLVTPRRAGTGLSFRRAFPSAEAAAAAISTLAVLDLGSYSTRRAPGADLPPAPAIEEDDEEHEDGWDDENDDSEDEEEEQDSAPDRAFAGAHAGGILEA